MKVVSTEELINYKILPFNVFSEFGEKLFAAGEVLTPGKLLQLRQLNVLFRDENASEASNPPPAVMVSESMPSISQQSPPSKITEVPVEKPTRVVIETFDMNPVKTIKHKLSVDDIDILSYKGPINKKAKIDPQTQIKIKAFYNKILEMMVDAPPVEMVGMFSNVRDKIVQDIIYDSDDALLCSQIKLLGEYSKCHSLNTAILSGAVAKKWD